MSLKVHASTAMPETDTETIAKILPPYLVLIENDDHHSMDFVIMVLQKVFNFDLAKAFQLMLVAHEEGEAVVWTGAKEVAELKCDQVQSFHQTHADGRALGPLGCRIEPST